MMENHGNVSSKHSLKNVVVSSPVYWMKRSWQDLRFGSPFTLLLEFEAQKQGSDKGDTMTRVNNSITFMRGAQN